MTVPGRKGEPGPVLAMDPPLRVAFSLRTHTPSRADGERVEAGDPIAIFEDVPVHSPLTGKVRLLDDRVQVEGELAEPRRIEASPGDLVTAARRAGLVGLGGGMYPTHRKLSAPAEVVLVNGCQSEPYVTCDACVLATDREGVVGGLALARAAVGASRGEIVQGEGRYPDGYERYLVERVLGRSLPHGARPQDVGALVLNVQTVRALHKAVVEGRPLVDRVLTVAGGAVGRPGNYLVPIGSEVGAVLRGAAVDNSRVAALVAGGPMMGREVGPRGLVEAGTIALLALTPDEVWRPDEEDCVRCGECAEVCPEGLLPSIMLERRSPSVHRCIECGACQFHCSSGRPLVRRIRGLKEELS